MYFCASTSSVYRICLSPSTAPPPLPSPQARTVSAWPLQMRVLLVGAAAELGLAQEVWPSPYDEVTFSETISLTLRQLLQVGAWVDGRRVVVGERWGTVSSAHLTFPPDPPPHAAAGEGEGEGGQWGGQGRAVSPTDEATADDLTSRCFRGVR